MTDLIPPKARKLAGIIITLVVGLLAMTLEWQDMGPEYIRWAGRVFAALLVVSNVFGLSVTSPKVKP